MFGFSKIFRSRWRALFWSAGILWLAHDVAMPDPPPPDSALAAESSGAAPDVAALKALSDLETRNR